MAKNLKQPGEDDVVKGGQRSDLIGNAVLGGREGVLSRLASPRVEERIAALSEALRYGEEGLDWVIRALQDESGQVQWVAYQLLRQRTEPTVKKTLKNYNPYQLFEYLYTLEGHLRLVNTLAISPDGQRLVSGGYDRSIEVWDLQTRQVLYALETRPPEPYSIRYDVKSVAISPSGQTLVSADDNRYSAKIQVWDLKTGQKSYEDYANDAVDSVAISSDGKLLVAATTDSYWCNSAESRISTGEILLWDLPTGKRIHTFYLPEEFNSVKAVAISPDRKTIVSGNGGLDKTARVWDVKKRTNKQTFNWHSREVNAIAISPDGKMLVSGSSDCTIAIGNLKTGRQLHSFEAHSSFVNSMAISPDGRTIVSASRDKTVKLWDLKSGKLLVSLSGHLGGVNAVAFSPDGATVFSGSSDGTIKAWGILQ